MITTIRLDAARAVLGMVSKRPGEEGYNPDGELPTHEAPIRAKAALKLVEAMVGNAGAAPVSINVAVLLPEKKILTAADPVKVLEETRE